MTPMFFIPLVAILASVTSAEPAACVSGFEWNKNSLGQDPCTIASKLQASCSHNSTFAFQAHKYYPGTTLPDDLCLCNTVIYSLVVACVSCQGFDYATWVEWGRNCDSAYIYISSYPNSIADGTAIPFWAFYDVTGLSGASYYDAVAMKVGRDPEAFPNNGTTGVPPPTTGSTEGMSTSTSSTGGMSISTSSTEGVNTSTSSAGVHNPTNANSTTNKGTDVRGVVVGVVGSVVPIIILAGAALLYVRNRRQKQAHQSQSQPYRGMFNQTLLPTNETPTAPVRLPLYDPSDPSTFPPPNLASLVTRTTSHDSYGHPDSKNSSWRTGV